MSPEIIVISSYDEENESIRRRGNKNDPRTDKMEVKASKGVPLFTQDRVGAGISYAEPASVFLGHSGSVRRTCV